MAKKVMFTLSAEVVGEATSGLLLGEFNNWDYNDGIELEKQKDGSMTAAASLESGKRYEYRYLLNDGRWVNDGSAHQYVHISGLQVENCVINVSEEIKETEKAAAPAKEKVKVAAKKRVTPKEKIVAEKKEEKVSAEKVIAPKVTTPKAKAAPKTKTPKA